MKMTKDMAKSAVYDVALFMKGGKIDPNSFLSWILSRMKNFSELLRVLLGEESNKLIHVS